MEEKIQMKKLNDHIYLMDDDHKATGYLVIGQNKALVIDTMNGQEDLAAIVRRVTDLPVMVVNTHGHPDHILGNVFFEEIYMHPADLCIASEFIDTPEFEKMCEEKGLHMPPFQPILPGEEIDLGGLHLSVIWAGGHTPGSILLLLKEDRILFTGDAINLHTWMQLNHCMALELFRDRMKELQYLTKEADYILHGHATDFVDSTLIANALLALEEIVAGKTEADADYDWFGGRGKQHRIPNEEGVICYNPISEQVRQNRIAWAESDAARDAGLTEPESLRIYRDLTYHVYGKYSLLDVYMPAEAKYSKKGLPILLNVHGGGYFYGDKELYRFYCMDMACRGFVVVNFNYRLSPEHKFPSAIQDINEVLCWIEANAEKYCMDVNNIFMMGDSAGAQLTSHYAAINYNAEFAKLFPIRKHSLKLRGIGLACGMYDIYHGRGEEDSLMYDYLGGNDRKDNKALDVLGAITKEYPPVFAFSCPNDFLCPQCEPFADYVNEKGGTAIARIYGTKEMTEVAHVFHCNLRLELGETARRDQAEFFLSLCKG